MISRDKKKHTTQVDISKDLKNLTTIHVKLNISMWVLFKLPIVFDDENRANLTTPTGFSIEPSSIPGAGLGAWAKVPVRMFSVIGEYEGDEHTDNEASTNYQWNVR